MVNALLLLLTACEPGPLPAGDPAQPDVIVVSIDTLRAGHLSAYGNPRPTSPFIDQLAASGARYAHARSPSPWTLPAHTTMLSGQLPATHQVIEDHLSLGADVPVLPEVFKAAGYATGGFVATLYVSRVFGFDRGFDRFEDFDLHTEKKNLQGRVDAEDVVDAALKWWSELPEGKPAFVFLHFYDVHYEYDPPEPYETMFDRAPQKGDLEYKHYFHFKKNPPSAAQLTHQKAQYDEAIRYVDDQLARIGLATTARSVRWVVTADHGEEFGERGSWGHAHTLYSEQLHVPLVISGAGLPSGAVVEQTVGTHDIAPTVASWIGGSVQADGVDLASPPTTSRAFSAETTRFATNRVGLLEGGLRLDWDLKANRRELYAPAADPAETVDLSKRRPADVARLSARLEDVLGQPWVARRAGLVTSDGVILKDGRRSTLRVQAGDRFIVLPYDAEVWVTVGDAVEGPWDPSDGRTPPEGAGLEYVRETSSAGVDLDEETRRALESLGYMQDGE